MPRRKPDIEGNEVSPNLTRLDWVKGLLGITGPESDEALSTLIADVSAIVTDYLGRYISPEPSVREWVDIYRGQKEISLQKTPVQRVRMVRAGRNVAVGFTPPADTQWATDGAGMTIWIGDTETRITWEDNPTASDVAETLNSLTGWTASTSRGDVDMRTVYPARGEGPGELCYPPDFIEAQSPPITERYLRACGDCFPRGCSSVFVWYYAGWTPPVEGEDPPQHTLPRGIISAVNDIVITVWQASQATGAGASGAAASGSSALEIFCSAVKIDDYSESYDAAQRSTWARMATLGASGLVAARKGLLEPYRLVEFTPVSGSCCCGSCQYDQSFLIQ